MPNLDQITLLQLDGKLTQQEFAQALNLALSGCSKLYEMQKDALRKRYFGASEATSEAIE